MAPRDEPEDVDFVVGADQAADELLPEPPRRPRHRNPMLIIAAVVVAALGVLGVVRLAGNHAHRPAAASSVPAPVVPNPQLRDREVWPVPGLREAAADTIPSELQYCPPAGDGESVCSTSRHLPASVQAALRAHLPAARHIHGLDEQLRDTGYGSGGLWYREVRARVGHATVKITVARQRTSPPEEAMMLPQYVGFWFHHAGLYVRTVVHLDHPRVVPILRLMALTRDPRLRTAA